MATGCSSAVQHKRRASAMPQLMDTIGTGMTRHGVVEFDWSRRDDVDMLIKAVVETANRSNFATLSRRLLKFVEPILTASGLPTEASMACVRLNSGAWTNADGVAPAEPLTLPELVQDWGYQPDSPEGYA